MIDDMLYHFDLSSCKANKFDSGKLVLRLFHNWFVFLKCLNGALRTFKLTK